jgi:hypothetical protein
LATSCFVGHPLTLGAKQSEVCALDIVNTELDAVRETSLQSANSDSNTKRTIYAVVG